MGALLAVACALVASGVAVWLTIHICVRHQIGMDHPSESRKIHGHPTPRTGGVGIVLGYVLTLAVLKLYGYPWVLASGLLLTTLPVFLVGFAEDLTNKVGATLRYVAAMFSALIGCGLIGSMLHRVDIPFIDALLAFPVICVAVSVFASASVAHAMNLIDGSNGLCSMTSVVAFLAICGVAWAVGDQDVMIAAAVAAGAFFGFFLFNFPIGRIFLGDGGAYTAGLFLAQLSILLVARNPQVSAWFPLLLLLYPIWETLFTVYRRAVKQRVSLATPDSLHMHHLVYRRVVLKSRAKHISERFAFITRGSLASVIMWGFVLITVTPALIWWDNTPVLMALALVYAFFYSWVYDRLAKSRPARVIPRLQSAATGLKIMAADAGRPLGRNSE